MIILAFFKSFSFWLKNPQLIIPRISYYFWEITNPDKPWMCRGTIDFLENHLTKDMNILEFGSGRSTFWFCQFVKNIVSVEYDIAWYENVKQKLSSNNVTNVDLRYIELDHPLAEGEKNSYTSLPKYVKVLEEFLEASLDLIVVDGHYRTTCTKNCFSKIKPGGYLLIDDTNMWQSLDSLQIPIDWQIVDQSTNGIKTCVIWQKP